MDPIEPVTTPTVEPMRLGGIRRGMATFVLAVGLLAVGGAAVVMAASPEPSASQTPSTQPSTTDDDSGTSTDRPSGVDCPEGSDGQAPQPRPRPGRPARTPDDHRPRRLASAAVDHEIAAALSMIDHWGADHAVAAVVGPDGVIASRGELDRRFRWASVTKLATALAVLDAVEDGLLDLDEPAGPPSATVRHLLAHASGLPFEGEAVLARPGTRRIYSNPGFDSLGALLAQRDGVPFEVALRQRVLEPLGMVDTELVTRPSDGLHGPLRDLAALARELLRPTIVTQATLDIATSTAFPGLTGMLPGVGRFDPLDWGLGFELRDGKDPHWTGNRNSPGTFGHFGGSGAFLWVDPALDRALACLTDRDYGPWALEAWPPFSDGVIAALAG